MAKYPDLATLRSALTSDDPERRSEAYGAVYEDTDLSPSQVLNDDETVDALRQSGLLETPEDVLTAQEYREQALQLLERIATAVEA